MDVLALAWGILAILGMVVAFFPCLGWLNWLNVPFSVAGLVIGVMALTAPGTKPRGNAVAGVVCCAVAVLMGIIRLVLGGGIL